MMSEPLLKLPADSAERLVKKRQLKVRVYTPICIFSGYAYHL
ncbi:hypothetical protein ACFLXT_03780 [Chloroflexota bacterium]